jgi:hypothetical protein
LHSIFHRNYVEIIVYVRENKFGNQLLISSIMIFNLPRDYVKIGLVIIMTINAWLQTVGRNRQQMRPIVPYTCFSKCLITVIGNFYFPKCSITVSTQRPYNMINRNDKWMKTKSQWLYDAHCKNEKQKKKINVMMRLSFFTVHFDGKPLSKLVASNDKQLIMNYNLVAWALV